MIDTLAGAAVAAAVERNRHILSLAGMHFLRSLPKGEKVRVYDVRNDSFILVGLDADGKLISSTDEERAES